MAQMKKKKQNKTKQNSMPLMRTKFSEEKSCFLKIPFKNIFLTFVLRLFAIIKSLSKTQNKKKYL